MSTLCIPSFSSSYSSQTPVLNDVRDVTVAANNRRGTIVLVSYENKVTILLKGETNDVLNLIQAPPQLWKMEMVKDPETNLRVARLVLRYAVLSTSRVLSLI